MITIKKLHVRVLDKKILAGVDLTIKPGELHVIMGPNGSGKSTLASTLIGDQSCAVTSGSVVMDGHDVLRMSPEERAHAGIFLAFQSPVAIPGVTVATLLKASNDAIREARGEKRLEPIESLNLIRKHAATVGLPAEFIRRSVNEGFSGGERKRLELLQMLFLSPSFIILDEVDSGMDSDGIQLVATLIAQLRKKGTSFLIISHQQYLLNEVKPTKIHVLKQGKIVASGGIALARSIEKKGYEWIKKS